MQAAKLFKSVAAYVVWVWHDPPTLIRNSDIFAIAFAVLLPWSTTGFTICLLIWVFSLLAAPDVGAYIDVVKRPICILPTALFYLVLAGTLWSEVPWDARLYAVKPALKLLVLPPLLYHFERTSRGSWVLVAFVISCFVLMVTSWVVALYPELALRSFDPGQPGVFVKNYIDQSQEFALCAVGLAYPIMTFVQRRRILPAVILAVVALSFAFNMIFVVISRTALVTVPIMLAAFALLHLKPRAALLGACIVLLLTVAVWNLSPHLRRTISKFDTDYRESTVLNESSGLGSRLEFWRKSLRFFAEAPVFGHGTGSTQSLFEQAAVGQTGYHAEVVANPHNQTLYVAVQWGVTGVILLYAVWLLHLVLFRGDGLGPWIGLLVVVQNISTSLFNSHLFDFQEGWIYILGVGIAGGMTLRSKGDKREALGLFGWDTGRWIASSSKLLNRRKTLA